MTNRTANTLDLYLRGRTPLLDVTVENSSGKLVWQRLANEIIPAIIHLRSLAPEETFDVDATWNQRDESGNAAASGEYWIYGALLTEDGPITTKRSRLVIAARE